jgi:hypothetical protein
LLEHFVCGRELASALQGDAGEEVEASIERGLSCRGRPRLHETGGALQLQACAGDGAVPEAQKRALREERDGSAPQAARVQPGLREEHGQPFQLVLDAVAGHEEDFGHRRVAVAGPIGQRELGERAPT